ncbi:MAG: NifB/NifX family molybdenum-iron cluster-binding protein [Deferribacterota bacterium]|nr:NifB/NifX family molybdenum-iron cluster-binding protein [Deferribacterota bacterium]
MKIAIPSENGVLSPHFGRCETFYIATVENSKIIESESLIPPEHGQGVFPQWLADKGVNIIIAGGMGPKAVNFFNQYNIDVYLGAETKKVEELVNDLINDKLKTTGQSCPGGHLHQCHD